MAPTPSPQKSSWRDLWLTLKQLWPFARPDARFLVLASLLVLGSAAMVIAPPWVIRYAVDHLLVPERANLLPVAALALLGLSVLEGICDFAARYLAELAGQGLVYRLRNALFAQLHRLSFSFYDRARVGELMSRVTEDAGILHHFFGFGATRVITNVFTLIGMAGVMLYWDWLLGLAFLLLSPLLAHAITAFSTRVRPLYGQIQQEMAHLSESSEENVQAMELVKVMGAEPWQRGHFIRQNRRYLDQNLKAIKVSAFWMPYITFITGLATLVALAWGGWEVLAGRTSPGTLVAFITYTQMLTRPLRQTGMLVGQASRAAAAGRRTLDILELEPEVRDAPDAITLPPVRGHVRYEKVSFAYSGYREVLEDVDLDASPGETVAVVGPTGAGKTTLLHLLPRFYEPTSGRILVDGYDVSRVTLESLRQQVGIVMQETFLFHASLRDNIAFGRPEAPMDEVRQAAQRARIAEFIEALPQGYETPVGDRGLTLSGGQRQRVAIARVLLTNPALLILDEATSELDPQTESQVRAAIQEAVRGRTTFVIAHRLQTVQQADRIVVLEGGRLTEMGTHRELLSRGGFYARALAAAGETRLTWDPSGGENR